MTIEEIIKIVKVKFPTSYIYDKYYIYKNKYILTIGVKDDAYASCQIAIDKNKNIEFFNEFDEIDNLEEFKKAVNNSKTIDDVCA